MGRGWKRANSNDIQRGFPEILGLGQDQFSQNHPLLFSDLELSYLLGGGISVLGARDTESFPRQGRKASGRRRHVKSNLMGGVTS